MRERWRRTFRHVLVDEYQDTNHAQYRLLQLLASEHGNLMVVGDEDQCLVEGTMVTMGDGSRRPIEELSEGDMVMSCYGSADFRPARVTGVFKVVGEGGRRDQDPLRPASGRALPSTCISPATAWERAPQMHLTYLMWKRGVGFRVGVTGRLHRREAEPRSGFVSDASTSTPMPSGSSRRMRPMRRRGPPRSRFPFATACR